jgi:ectoine hydroxylase-related dioxygenase (phytanoyl-CoA dioxygenase family)
MLTVNCRRDPAWLQQGVAALEYEGGFVVEDVVAPAMLAEARERMYDVQARIRADVGEDRLTRAGELGVLRLMLAYDEWFMRFLELPELLAIVDATVSPTAVLHLQNGFVLPPTPPVNGTEAVFQQRFHRDFPRHMNGYLASINTLIAIDEFTAENGGTLVVPATHQRAEQPPAAYLEAMAEAVECPPGAVIVFDSTLWHAAGRNASARDRLGINQQFTRSFLKQQIDYVRALGDDVVERQAPRTQQLLGWYTRVVSSLDEYYRPAEERLYRSGQG